MEGVEYSVTLSKVAEGASGYESVIVSVKHEGDNVIPVDFIGDDFTPSNDDGAFERDVAIEAGIALIGQDAFLVTFRRSFTLGSDLVGFELDGVIIFEWRLGLTTRSDS